MMNKRLFMVGGVAAAAGLAGVGIGWWRIQPHAVQGDALDSFWQSTWEDPMGQPMAMSDFKGRPLLVNFWATWCPICVRGLPALNAFYQEHQARGWTVLGMAIDRPSAVRDFLQRQPIDFPIAIGGVGGTDLSRLLGNPTGGVPYNVVLNAQGQITHSKLGEKTASDLALWSQSV